MWHCPDSSDQWTEEGKEVAVKSMRRGSCEKERVRFLQEATIMGQFNNPNILCILGIITDSEDNNVCMKFSMLH